MTIRFSLFLARVLTLTIVPHTWEKSIRLSSKYFLSLTLRTIPLGVAYAIWSGVGVVFVSLFGWLFFRQNLDAAAIGGMTLIVAGVIVLNLFSKSVPH